MDPANLIPSGSGNGWKDRTVRGYRTNPGLCQTAARQATRRSRLSAGDGAPGPGVLLADRHEGFDKQDTIRPGNPVVREIGWHEVRVPNHQFPRLPRDSEGDRSFDHHPELLVHVAMLGHDRSGLHGDPAGHERFADYRLDLDAWRRRKRRHL